MRDRIALALVLSAAVGLLFLPGYCTEYDGSAKTTRAKQDGRDKRSKKKDRAAKKKKKKDKAGKKKAAARASKKKKAAVPDHFDADPSAILFITLEATRADSLVAHGQSAPPSKALTQLATTGVLVRRAISPMPNTVPAHVSAFTGLYPRSHGVKSDGGKLRGDAPSLALWAQAQGYSTAAFVSRRISPRSMNLRGFETQSAPKRNQQSGATTLARATQWLQDNAAKPYFLWVHFGDPHSPYDPPANYLKRFGAKGDPPSHKSRRDKERYTDEEVASLTARYWAEVAYQDMLVRTLVARVKALRPPKHPPLIFVMADHGETLGELNRTRNYGFDHGRDLYQGALHVPMLLAWEGRVPAGKTVEAPVSLVDVPATLFDVIEAEGFETQGESFMKHLGAATGGPRYEFSERRHFRHPSRLRLPGDEQFAVQDERYKLIVTLPIGDDELYDLQQDVDESRNLAASRPAERKRLRKALDRWFARTR